MRRSRASLVLFFATFAALLHAVGFADGGHLSTGRPIDVYRLDVDDPSDSWQCIAEPAAATTDCLAIAASIAEESSADESLAAADCRIMIPLAGSPFGIALYVDDETACLLACQSTAALSPFVNEFAGCIAGPLPDDQDWTYAPIAPSSEASDDLGWHSEASLGDATPDLALDLIEDLLTLDVAASLAGVPSEMLWREAIDHAERCDFAWDGCDAIPDASVGAILAERGNLAVAELFRTVGHTVWEAMAQFIRERDFAIAMASRSLAGWLQSTTVAENYAPAAPSADEHQATISAGLCNGTLIAL